MRIDKRTRGQKNKDRHRKQVAYNKIYKVKVYPEPCSRCGQRKLIWCSGCQVYSCFGCDDYGTCMCN